MVNDLTEIATLSEVINTVSENMNLPSLTVRHLKRWGSSRHLLRKGVPSTFRKTFEMKPDSPFLSKLKLGQRVGERTKLKKVKNLIIGWLSEEIASEVLRKNKFVKTIEPSGIDIGRTVEIRSNPTDPDYRIQLRNDKILFLEVASIGKLGDGLIRLKYNKVKRNMMKYFGLSKGRSVHWPEHFNNPCAYLCIDLVSRKKGNVIIEGSSFYVNQPPIPYEGWENQEVVMFDTQKRLTLSRLASFDMQNLRERIVKDVSEEFHRINRAVQIFGNPLLMVDSEGHVIKEFLKRMFELDHMISLTKRRDKREKEQIEQMRRDLLDILEEIPTQNRRRLRSLMSNSSK
jgi:hypothetical protein